MGDVKLSSLANRRDFRFPRLGPSAILLQTSPVWQTTWENILVETNFSHHREKESEVSQQLSTEAHFLAINVKYRGFKIHYGRLAVRSLFGTSVQLQLMQM